MCAGKGDAYHRELCEWQMRVGNGTQKDARGRPVGPFTEILVRISSDLIVAGEDLGNLINGVSPSLDAFGPDKKTKLAFRR